MKCTLLAFLSSFTIYTFFTVIAPLAYSSTDTFEHDFSTGLSFQNNTFNQEYEQTRYFTELSFKSNVVTLGPSLKYEVRVKKLVFFQISGEAELGSGDGEFRDNIGLLHNGDPKVIFFNEKFLAGGISHFDFFTLKPYVGIGYSYISYRSIWGSNPARRKDKSLDMPFLSKQEAPFYLGTFLENIKLSNFLLKFNFYLFQGRKSKQTTTYSFYEGQGNGSFRILPEEKIVDNVKFNGQGIDFSIMKNKLELTLGYKTIQRKNGGIHKKNSINQFNTSLMYHW